MAPRHLCNNTEDHDKDPPEMPNVPPDNLPDDPPEAPLEPPADPLDNLDIDPTRHSTMGPDEEPTLTLLTEQLRTASAIIPSIC